MTHKDVHGHMAFSELCVSHGKEDDNDHHEFGHFIGPYEGTVEYIPEHHIDSG
jgi:hypothetical protein